jgi:hypothetical protein
MDQGEARQRLIEFCDNTDSGLRFVPVADPAPHETSSTTSGSERPL